MGFRVCGANRSAEQRSRHHPRQVIAYISELPDAEQNSREWQNARKRILQAADRSRVYLVRAHRDHPGTSTWDASFQETKLEPGRAKALGQTGCRRCVTTHGSRGTEHKGNSSYQGADDRLSLPSPIRSNANGCCRGRNLAGKCDKEKREMPMASLSVMYPWPIGEFDNAMDKVRTEATK